MRVSLRRQSTRYRVPGPAIAAGALLMALGIAAAILPADEGGPVICPFRAVTGLPCPTCGMVRATRLVLHGNLVAALRVNPLDAFVITVAAPIALVLAILHYIVGISVHVLLGRRERVVALWVLAVIVGANWAYVLAVQC